MSVSNKQNMEAFLADTAITKGMAVKIGSDSSHVAKGAANTDRCFGICQNDPTVAEDACEVALPGGGAKGLLGENVVKGNYLVSHTDGKLVKANALGDHICAMAMEDGSSGDLINVLVIASPAAEAQA